MKWEAKVIGETVYDMSHLHPCVITMTWPAKGELPEKTVGVAVEYSMHCFTAAISIGSAIYDSALQYQDSKETRQFHLERYEHSKALPALIQNLSDRLCYTTPHRNYFIPMPHPDGVSEHLRLFVYFVLAKRRREDADLTMYIESAHCKEKPKLGRRVRGCSFKELCGKILRS